MAVSHSPSETKEPENQGQGAAGEAALVAVAVAVALILLGAALWAYRRRLRGVDMLSWIHWLSYTVGAAQIAFILYYYVPIADRYLQTANEGRRDGTFISDLLFSDAVYRSVMTGFIAVQLGMCILFVARLRSRTEAGPSVFCVELFLFAGAWVGWTVLCAEYTDPSNPTGMSKVHTAGVGVFVACSLGYIVVLTCNVFSVLTAAERASCAPLSGMVLQVIFLCVSLGLGMHFVALALMGDPSAWVTEHLSLVFFVACHVLLFLVDSAHDRGGASSEGGGGVGCVYAGNSVDPLFEGVKIQLTFSPSGAVLPHTMRALTR